MRAGSEAVARASQLNTVVTLLAVAAACFVAAGCREVPRFDAKAIAAHHMLEGAPPGFLLGAATSAHQIEGGTRNDWTAWEKGTYPDGTPHVADRESAARAADSWNLWRDDVAALRTLGANVYRIGIEWSRLEPSEGKWDVGAADRYREMLSALRAAGVAPFVTLWHFTLPPWLAARGGWEAPDAVAAFAAFAARAGAAFGDLVDLWCTINEPNVFVTKGFLAAQWPPGARDPARAAAVMRALLFGHAAATRALRTWDRTDADADGTPTRIGIAQNIRIFDAASPLDPVDGIVAGGADTFYNESFLDAVDTGRIRMSLPPVVSIDEPAPELIGTFDYLGINYYTREIVRGHLFRGSRGVYEQVVVPGRPRNDMGWEIYPEGLYRVLVRYAGHGWPLIVTESGLADRAGDVRPDFIRAHVYALDRARAEGVDVRGFIHWSLMDNFEWSHGYRGRFGLFSVDFDGDPALTRRPTAAVPVFQEAARGLGLLPAGAEGAR